MIYKIILLVAVSFNIIAQLCLKSAMRGYNIFSGNMGFIAKLIDIIRRPLFLLSLLFYGAGFFLYSIILSKLELSKAYPIASLAAIVAIAFISVVFLRESMSITKGVGLVLCITGIVLLFQ